MMTDPIADMLTRVRNAVARSFECVEMPASKIKAQIADVFLKEGYISGYEVQGEGVQRTLKISLKYVNGESALQGLKRVSKPGIRKYTGKAEIPRVLGGFGTAILSTSKGVVPGKTARQLGVGGEVICYIW